MIDWIKSHWLFCIFAGVVLILVIVLICVAAYRRKKERELNGRPKRLVIKRNNLDKKQEENLKISKPIIKGNLRTGEKVKRNVKIKEQPQEEQPLEDEEIEEKPKKDKKEEKIKEKEKKQAEKAQKAKEKEEKEQMKKVEKKPAKKAEPKKAEAKKPVKKAEPKKVEEKRDETYRVVYDKEQKNWVVKIDGGERASRRCSTKEEALKVAKDLAKKKDADLSVHKKNGKFQKQ